MGVMFNQCYYPILVIYKVEVIGSALFRSTGHHIMPLYFILLDVQSPFVVFFCFYFDETY